jgi:hypothetical protein
MGTHSFVLQNGFHGCLVQYSTMDTFMELGYSPDDSIMLADAYDAITKADLWDYMRKPSTPGKDGFMFCTDAELVVLSHFMKYDKHSGASYGWTMRVMEDIAKSGMDGHKKRIIAKRLDDRTLCPCRAEKELTRGWCGNAGGGVPACDH